LTYKSARACCGAQQAAAAARYAAAAAAALLLLLVLCRTFFTSPLPDAWVDAHYDVPAAARRLVAAADAGAANASAEAAGRLPGADGIEVWAAGPAGRRFNATQTQQVRAGRAPQLLLMHAPHTAQQVTHAPGAP
jgi:hypothetical protein